jgi:hypothetical protein
MQVPFFIFLPPSRDIPFPILPFFAPILFIISGFH